MQQKQIQRQSDKDIAKAIGIYLVVTGHLLNEQAVLGHALIYMVHMPLFFWISGYFLYGSVQRHSLSENVRGKVRTLLIPFLVWSGVALAANLAMAVLKGGLTAQTVFQNFFEIYLQARSMWFLLILFLAQMMLLTVHQLLKEKKMAAELSVMAVLWVLISICLPDTLLSMDKLKWMLPYLMLGYWMGSPQSQEKIKIPALAFHRHRAVWTAGCSAVYLLAVTLLHGSYSMNGYLSKTWRSVYDAAPYAFYFAVSLCGIAGLMGISQLLSETGAGMAAAKAGRCSMDIYVIHMFFIKFITFVPGYARKSDLAYNLGYVPFYALVVVMIVYLMAAVIFRKIGLYRMVMGLPENKTDKAEKSADREGKAV